LTSAVGATDVSVDRSMLTGQWVKAGPRSVVLEDDRRDPCLRRVKKRKRKKGRRLRFLGLKSLGRLSGPTWFNLAMQADLASARLAASRPGSVHGSLNRPTRPVALQTGSGFGRPAWFAAWRASSLARSLLVLLSSFHRQAGSTRRPQPDPVWQRTDPVR
jgi:hypothetical protein